ncbi:hypothetical protein HYX08_03685 [Candidatus Woesearchaeota archaeon]|nr:hypothetical protein [Candidatus Woesearchaeota archaeon]
MNIMKAQKLLLFLIISMFLVNVAYAAGSKLIFSDVDVKVGSKTSKNLNDRDTIDDEAEPGDSIEFRVETSNNFTSTEDLKIEDISVTVTIEGIDDGDDLEEESQDFNLNPGRDKKITLKFQTPIEVDEDSFDVTIHAEGEDENGTDHEADMRLTLEVDKESHLLKITRASLSPAEVSCNRKNVQAAVTVINIGNEDEEDVTVQVLNSDLGVELSQDAGELTAEPNEDESRFSHIFAFNVPSDAEAGSYPVVVRALYDENRKKAEETITLTVSDCETSANNGAKESSEGEDVTVITPTTGRTTTVVQPEPGTAVTTESFFKSNAFVVGIIIAEIVAVIVGIALVVSLFRRKG